MLNSFIFSNIFLLSLLFLSFNLDNPFYYGHISDCLSIINGSTKSTENSVKYGAFGSL